ncbi:MAG: ergothioneine biosynthesis protein EgtB [Flavobacteriales bacterium]|jgi:ergothioneine biosynthesis protein EgtB
MMIPVHEKESKKLSFSLSSASFYGEVRKRTTKICKPLKAEDMVVQPEVFVSPAKWHLGHTTWFFEAFILDKFVFNYQAFHPQYAFVFNSYYNAMGNRVIRSERGNLSRPTTEDIYLYRNHVDRQMIALLNSSSCPEEVQGLLMIGLNHEQQHQELMLTDIKYVLGCNPLMPEYDAHTSLVHVSNKVYGFTAMPEGLYEIGHDGQGFAYDNELGVHKVFLHNYEIENSLVTNAEFINFIEAGGYQNSDLWLDEGWTWLKENKYKAPLYWFKEDNGWHHYTLNGYQTIDLDDQLAHISFYEAAAFAEWRGMRLPTEFEWEAAANKLTWGTRWEWTNSAYLPYPGYIKPEGAFGEYNGKFMMNQMVLRGASTATALCHSRKSYRNFFQAGLRWQVTGIRLVKK